MHLFIYRGVGWQQRGDPGRVVVCVTCLSSFRVSTTTAKRSFPTPTIAQPLDIGL